MEKFINAKDVVVKNDYTHTRVDKLIKIFNKKILLKQENAGGFTVTTNTDNFERLTPQELAVAEVEAANMGWKLSIHFGNKDYITYLIKKKD